MGKQFGRIKKTIAILLAVLFIVSLAAASASAYDGYGHHGYYPYHHHWWHPYHHYDWGDYYHPYHYYHHYWHPYHHWHRYYDNW